MKKSITFLMIFVIFLATIKAENETIEKYIRAIGGKDKISAIKTVVIKGKMTMYDGTVYDEITYYKLPSHILTLYFLKGKLHQKILMTNNAIANHIVSQKKTTHNAGKQVQNTFIASSIIPELVFEKYKVKAAFFGKSNGEYLNMMKNFDNPKKYNSIIDIIKLSLQESIWYYCYDTKTNLRVASFTNYSDGFIDKESETLVEYLSYKNVEGVYFIDKLKTYVGGKFYVSNEYNSIEINVKFSDKIFQINE